MDVIGFGLTDGFLTGDEVDMILADSLAKLPLDGQRVLVLIPDATRTMPLHLFFSLLTARLLGRVRALDFMVALGTHPPLDEEALLRLVGLTPEQKAASYPNVNLFNHAWKDPQALVTLGTIPAAEIARLIPAEIAGVGAQRLVMDVPVRLNRRILDYDHLLICGPVFPHEVVGFSGGNKYFFPGIAGSDIIDFTHWLGALITSRRSIGVKDTPMRRVIDRAAAMIPRPRHALCSVVTPEGIAGLFCGVPEEAWSAAADLSAQRHIHWCDRPYRRALAVLPGMYDELWVGAKGMYKLEPVIADGGELIIYAPHLKRVSAVHGADLHEIGYHVRDYFVKQWPRFEHYPGGVLAHSTHLRGSGTYENGIERPRIQVTLATGIPAEECAALNLGYCDPATIDPPAWAGREDEGILLVPHAGEVLYKLKEKE
jgi:nickel-dependent lactate racemase